MNQPRHTLCCPWHRQLHSPGEDEIFTEAQPGGTPAKEQAGLVYRNGGRLSLMYISDVYIFIYN